MATDTRARDRSFLRRRVSSLARFWSCVMVTSGDRSELPKLPDWARSSSCLVSVLKESVRAVELTGCWRSSGVGRVVRRIVARPADRGNGSAERVATAGAGADGANREFGKMIAQGRHVTPSIESNPLTACTRIGIQRFVEAAEGSKKAFIYSKIQSLKQLSYKAEIHNCVQGTGCATHCHLWTPPDCKWFW